MQDYKKMSHTVWDCKYHIVWTTKYRYSVFGGKLGERYRELIRKVCRHNSMTVYSDSVNRDHMHLLISIPSSLSVLKAVQLVKGKSSHKMGTEMPQLRK